MASKAEKSERILNAVFQMESKQDGDQVVDAVSTREGVKLIVHNPVVDERFALIENDLLLVKEDVDDLKDDMNNNREDVEDLMKQKEKKKSSK